MSTYQSPSDYLRAHENSEAVEELRARLAERRLRTWRCGLCGVLAAGVLAPAIRLASRRA